MMPKVGDLVRCIVGHYTSIKRGEIRRVVSVDDYGNIVLRNRLSPNGKSTYCVWNFALYKRKSAIDAGWRKNMLHIAVQIDEGQDWNKLADMINDRHRPTMMAETSASAIKERVRQRVIAYPNERWLILSGNTIGEISSPPVRFRAV